MANDFKAQPSEMKPREIMDRESNVSMVPDEVLLAILLRTGGPGCNVVKLARKLLEVFGGLRNLVTKDWRRLQSEIDGYNKSHPDSRLLGIGSVKCRELAAAFELARRSVRLSPDEIKRTVVKNPAAAFTLFRHKHELYEEQEVFFVLPLDVKKHPICEPQAVFKGTLNSAPVHVREVFKNAIRWSAHSILVAHCHPSGDPEPSGADIELTKKLLEASSALDIALEDHLVICGNDKYVSLRAIGTTGDGLWG